MKHLIRAVGTVVSVAILLTAPGRAPAQTVTAIPKIDLNQYMGAWYEVAKLPVKREKGCLSDAVVLYSLGDRKNTFQMVTSCSIKNGNSDAWNARGKTDKAGDGKLKISYLWPFSTKYWVLAMGYDMQWVLVGSPNRKSLWLLSKTPRLALEALAEAKTKAVAQGFDPAKLIPMVQHEPVVP